MIARIKYAILRRLFNLYVSSFDGNKFKKDVNYNLDLINDCFMDRKSKTIDPSIFERISNSYILAKKHQKNADSVYQVGNEWVPIYKKYMGEIMKVLTERDFHSMELIYNNFMREPCSVGLHGIGGYERMTKNYFSGSISLSNARVYMKDVVNRYNIWNSELGSLYSIESLKGPLLGNTYGHFVDGIFVEGGAYYNHYYAAKISELLKEKSHSHVLELGGGFGNMAYYLMQQSKKITYFDFDLPENFALTAFYLLSSFPDKKIALYGEVDLENENVNKYDLILMPNFEIDKVGSNSIDLVFNSYSLAEMPPETIKNYISIINRVSNNYIYHLNHTKFSSMSADEFPINLDKFELLKRKEALWNKAINFSMDEFEFLYKVKKLNN